MDTVGEHEIGKNLSFSEMVIPTLDSIRNIYLLGRFLTNKIHVICTGPTGTGKTINIETYLKKRMGAQCIPLITSYSAQTSANDAQAFLDSKMDKRKKGVYGPAAGKQYIVFVDDFNMPQREIYGAQPPVELIRQAIGQVGWYDTKTLAFRNIIDCTYIMSMGPPGGGRNVITERILEICRHLSQS